MDVCVPWDNSTEPFDEVIDSILEDIFHRNGWMDISVSLGVNIICGEIFAWEFLAHEIKSLVRAQFKEMYDENRHWIDFNFSICRFISDLLRYEDFSQQFGDVVRVAIESLFRHDGWTTTDPTFPMSNIINVLNLASSRRYRSGMIYQWTIFFRYNKRIYTEFQWRIQSRARFPRLPPEILEFIVNFVGASEWDAPKTKTLASLCLTSRAFYNQSCPYLYRNIRLEKPNDLLLKTLSQWSHLRGLTNTVKIHSKKTKTYHEFFVYSQHLFPDPHSLSIHGLRLLHPRFVTICRPFSSVTKLSILNFCEFSSVLDLRRFIGGLFPNLSHLTLHDPEILSSYVTLPNSAPRKSSSLSHVTFKTEGDNDTLYPVRQWLKLTSTTNLLHYISIDSKYLGDMILPFHRHLRVITIHWTSDGFELHKRYPELSFGFEVLPALERLILYLDKDGSDIYDFSKILSRSSPSSTLSSICFLIMENGSNYDFRNLKILDRELAQLSSNVRIEIDQDYWALLLALKARGVLAIPRG